MGSRRINQLLWSIATLCVAAGLLIGGTMALLPLEFPTARELPRKGIAATKPSRANSTQVDISLVGRTFRASAPPIVAATPSAAPPASDVSAVQLVGTIGDSIAMLRGPDGTTALVEVGDDVNGAAVLAIRPFQVDLKLNGRTTTLVKSDGSDTNASDPNAAVWPSQP